jgi:polyisoprenoid-binding protein YceI
MKKTMLIAVALLGTVSLNAQNYVIDKAHSTLGFVVTHLKYSEMPGDIQISDAKFSATKADYSDASIEMTADVNTLNTKNEGRDKHLKSADFFDAEKNPTITFKSKTFKLVKGTVYKVTGDLTMHGVTKTVELAAIMKGKSTNPFTKSDVYVWKVTGKIKRSEFGVGSTMPNDVVDDLVYLNANLEFGKE